MNNPFFWDTVQLGSKHANWIFEHDLQTILLPNNMDSGHPPFLGFLLATSWKIFGKSLFVSHLTMLPFICILIYQTVSLSKKLFPNTNQYFAIIIVLFDATLLAQSTLISPDIILISFFIMAVNGLILNNKFLLILSSTMLCIVSMRGMMCAFSLGLTALISNLINDKPVNFLSMTRIIVANLLPFFLGIMLIIGFLLFHYSETGWIGYHENSPWKESFDHVDFKGLIKNFIILVWRIIDFGRIGIILVLGFCIFKIYKNLNLKFKMINSAWKLILLLSIIAFIVTALPLMQYKNLLGHRYLMPIYFIFSIVMIKLVEIVFDFRYQKIVLLTVILIELSGNFWKYPLSISMGWDSTLAYLPYFGLRDKMLDAINKRKIPFSQIGTDFPNDKDFKYIDLKESKENFKYFNFDKDQYILSSSVYNVLPDPNDYNFTKGWRIIEKFESGSLNMILYERVK